LETVALISARFAGASGRQAAQLRLIEEVDGEEVDGEEVDGWVGLSQ
jgi:hypothetical protein